MAFGSIPLPARRFWLLAALFCVGFLALATFNARDNGLKYSDEGVYLAEAAWLLGENTQDIGYEPPFVSMKPLYSGLLAVAFKAAGVREAAAYLLNGILGALAVLGVILLGRALFSPATGLAGGALLALMPLHLAFARTALADVALSAFLVWTLYAYVRARQSTRVAGQWWGMFAAGLLLGLAYEAKFTAPLFVLVLFGLEVWWHPKAGRGHRLLRVQNWVFLAAGFLLVFFAFAGWYAALGLNYWLYFVQRLGQFAPGRLLLQLAGLGGLPKLAAEPFVAGEEGLLVNYGRYALNALNLVSWPVLALAAVGAIRGVRNPKGPSRVPALWLLGSVVVLLIIAYGVTRTMVFAAPAVALAAAAGIGPATRWLGARLRRQTLSPLWLMGLLVLVSAFGAAHVAAYKNPAPRAAAAQLLDDGLNEAFVNDHFTGFLAHRPAWQIRSREQVLAANYSITHLSLFDWKPLKGIEGDIWEGCPPFSSVPVLLEDWSYPYRQAAALEWLYAHAGPFQPLLEPGHRLLSAIPAREKEIRLYRMDDVRACLRSNR